MSKTKKTPEQLIAEALLMIYEEAHTDNSKNYPMRNMLSTMINKTAWFPQAKLNDAANHTAAVQALMDESIAQESVISGKVTMMPAAQSVVGAPHYDENAVNKHIRFAERDEFEARLHQSWVDAMAQAFEQLTGDKFIPKSQRKSQPTVNPTEWLAARKVAAE